jgi:hypothetical protein
VRWAEVIFGEKMLPNLFQGESETFHFTLQKKGVEPNAITISY